MKSVCILLQNHYDIDIRVRRKAEALVADGYLVDVFALSNGQGQKRYTLQGVNVHALSLGKKRGSLARYAFEYGAFFFWALFQLTVRMPWKRYTVIDVNTLPDFLVFAAALAKWMGARVVLDMHEITPEFYMSKYGIGPTSRWIRLLERVERISFDFADHVITINEPIEDLLVSRGLPRAKSTIITNSADETRFASCSQLAKPASAPHRFVMMYHGTLTGLYGLDIAIEALATVHEEIPGAELWILGSGPEKTRLVRLAQERGLASTVKFVGQVTPEEIPGWLQKCDAGILPIRRDVFLEFAFPNKLPEFIIMGKAVIVSRLRAIGHYFSADALAFFEPNDRDDLARQMIRLYRDPGLRARLAAKALEEHVSIRWDVMKRRYLEMMRDLVTVPVASTAQSRTSVEGAES